VFSNEYIELKPYDMATVHTGIAYQTPPGWALQVFSRSGLTRNHGVTTRGGVIDNGYTGEMVVVLKNEGRETFLIEPGDKIAQVKLERHYEASFEEVAELDATERGANGFGSTGMNEKSTCGPCRYGMALTDDGKSHHIRGLIYGPCTSARDKSVCIFCDSGRALSPSGIYHIGENNYILGTCTKRTQ